MGIRVIASQALTDYSAGRELGVVEGGTVGECLDNLTEKLPSLKQFLFDEKGGLREYVDVCVNRENVFPDPLKRTVKDGDELLLICLIGGG